MESYATYIQQLVEQGGPRDADYADLDHWYVDVDKSIRSGRLPQTEVAAIRGAFGDALSPATVQGFALAKPHGYAGDYELIDRIYQIYLAPQPHLASWDRFCHQHAGMKAVRNRKKYFHRLLDKHTARKQPLRVLKIASGPGRSMFEWFSAHPAAPITIDCVEIDPAAIEYASRLNHQFLDRITFTQKNALRFRPTGEYDLIWAAGIFDYFDDRLFTKLFQRLLPAVANSGEIVIGNFCDRNPSRAYMELAGAWMLHHRSGDHLSQLARQCGVSDDCISIGMEPEHVNFFLHVSRNSLAA